MKYVLKSTTRPAVRLDLARDLNAEQRAVVEAPAGEVLVLAGAGTGKTRTLIYRVAHFVAQGADPQRILLCTFTNRAAREMVSRIENLLHIDASRMSAGTFHQMGHRLLRRHGDAIGLGGDFGLLDPEDRHTLLATIIAEAGLSELGSRHFPEPKLLGELISLAHGSRTTLAEIVHHHRPRLASQIPTMEQIAQRFHERKRQMNVCDFDDLLCGWLDLLNETYQSSIVRNAYDHIFVDEYQDINALQGAICDAMAQEHRSLTCVGDDAQSIYSFRGADFQQISQFCQRHPQAKIYKLTKNYRSTPQILNLANRGITHNRNQEPKSLTAAHPDGILPAVIPLRDVFQQAEFVAQRILELQQEYGIPLKHMVVLYRNHSHSLELQVELTRRQIPFSIRSGLRFFEQAHIKDVLAYLRVQQNPRDTLAWIRMLRLWPGIGIRTAQSLVDRLQLILQTSTPSLSHGIAELCKDSSLPPRVRTSLTSLHKIWQALVALPHSRPGDIIRVVMKQHYDDYLQRTFTNADSRKEDLEQLAKFAQRYGNIHDFLSELTLVQGMVTEAVLPHERPEDSLLLSTIHQAKGLEWPICFVLWLADGRFPMRAALARPEDLEEERRLFYVAATRTAKELYLCYPMIEDIPDRPSRLLRASRFLSEIDHDPPVFERWQIEEQEISFVST